MFNFGKKNKETSPSCSCKCEGEISGENKDHSPGYENEGIRNIKVLGTGCKSCHALHENTTAAVSELDFKIIPAYITDMNEIITYGAMSMPALVINDRVVSMGKVLRTTEIIKILKKYI